MKHVTYRDAPAFPPDEYSKGLTKREYFAAQALAGIIANETGYSQVFPEAAEDAVRYADALIRALNK